MKELLRKLRICSLVSLFALTARQLPAQNAEVDTDLLQEIQNEALQAIRSGNTRKCVAALQKLTAAIPGDGGPWFQLGTCQKRLLHWKKAAESFTRAFHLEHLPSEAAYQVAVVEGWRSHTTESLEWLQKAAALGFNRPSEALGTGAFRTLRDTPRFSEIVEMMRANQSPCQHQQRYRVLDFWVGSWRVYSVRGDTVGHSRVSKAAAGCSVSESWESVSGGGGRSLSFLDPAEARWRYLWVDTRGAVIDAVGSLESNVMRFVGTRALIGGAVEPCRIQLKPLADGRVHHLIERSSDGETWQAWFDAIYVREPPE